MEKWFRLRALGAQGRNNLEDWQVAGKAGRVLRSYTLDVRTGKKLEVLKIKPFLAQSRLESEIAQIRSSRQALFKKGTRNAKRPCPACGSPRRNNLFKWQIYGALYFQCRSCGHCYVANAPADEAISKLYTDNPLFDGGYKNAKIRELRLKQIIFPKAEWMLEQFRRLYGRAPKAVLDVGAGSGDFVHALQQLGFSARGIELNTRGRESCFKNFNTVLDLGDFNECWSMYPETEVVTFWGVIEHLSAPAKFLSSAYKLLAGKEGMVIAEVPRLDSLTTTLQSLFPSRIIRHLDPLHLHVFTDDSLAVIFERSGFAPCAAWYLGLDINEFLIQVSLTRGDNGLIQAFQKYVFALQDTIDRAQISDTLILAGRPQDKKIRRWGGQL